MVNRGDGESEREGEREREKRNEVRPQTTYGVGGRTTLLSFCNLVADVPVSQLAIVSRIDTDQSAYLRFVSGSAFGD